MYSIFDFFSLCRNFGQVARESLVTRIYYVGLENILRDAGYRGVKSILLGSVEGWSYELINLLSVDFNINNFSLEILLDKIQSYCDGK